MRDAGERDGPGDRARRRAGRRQARRLGRRPAAARASSADDATAWLSPDDGLDDGDGFDDAARGAADERGPAGHRRTRSTPPTSAPSPRRGGRSRRCWSPATRCRPRSTPSWRARSPPTGVKVIRDPHLGTGISKSFLVDWGKLSARPGGASTSPTPSSCSSAPTRASRSGRRRRRGRVLRRRLGGDVRQPRARDDEHLPRRTAPRASTGSRCRRRATATARRSRASSTRRSTSPPQPWRAQVRVRRHDPDRSRPGSGYRDAMAIDGERHDRPRGRRHPPQRRRCSLFGRHRHQADRSGLRHKALTMSARGITVRAVLSRFYIPSGLLSVAVALTITAGASASPVASAAATCTPPKYPGSGYFTSLSVTKHVVRGGRKLAKDYYKCRTKTRVRRDAASRRSAATPARRPVSRSRPRSTPRSPARRAERRQALLPAELD